MVDLKEALGSKYNDIEKCGFVKDLEDLVTADSLISIDLDDVKKIASGEIVGSISTIVTDIDSEYEMNRISDKIPTNCLVNVESSRDLKLDAIDSILYNIRKLGDVSMEIILGTAINDELKGKYKVQALFSYSEE